MENRISKEYSPLTIIIGLPTSDARAYSIDLGAYVEVFEDNRWFQNSNQTRSIPMITLCLSPYRCLG